MNALRILPVDFGDAVRADHYLDLLDHYMRSPTGSGTALSADLRTRLTDELRQRPTVLCYVAYQADDPAGLLTCVEGFSTFAGRPLLNIHDIVVHARFRRRGIARALLTHAETVARERGCCKLTLEVLEGNAGARQAYLDFGFRGYELDPAMGRALFMEKRLAD